MPRWLLFSLLTVLAWGVWAVLSKPLKISAEQSQAFSTLGILPVMGAMLALRGFRRGERKRRGAALAFAAGLLVGLGNIAYYHAFSAGAKASVAASLTALYPVVTIVLAFVFLKEKLRAPQIAGIAATLAAIAVLSIPEFEGELSLWLRYALAPLAFWGVSGLLMKVATRHASAELSTFWFLASFIPLGAVLLAIKPMQWELSPRDWTLVVLLGFTYAWGNLTVLIAYGSGGKASIVTPMAGLYPIVSIPLAVLFLGEEIGRREWIGIGVALAAVTLLSVEPKGAAGS
jgi:drug/metabolite transporter (DMT)-like permease